MMQVSHCLLVSGLLFGIAMTGILLNRKNMIALLMCIELMLLSVNTNFVLFSHMLQDTAGALFVFFILTVAAAEAGIGLAILVLLYRKAGSVDLEDFADLKQ